MERRLFKWYRDLFMLLVVYIVVYVVVPSSNLPWENSASILPKERERGGQD